MLGVYIGASCLCWILLRYVCCLRYLFVVCGLFITGVGCFVGSVLRLFSGVVLLFCSWCFVLVYCLLRCLGYVYRYI